MSKKITILDERDKTEIEEQYNELSQEIVELTERVNDIIYDDEMSETSDNPVKNKAITKEIKKRMCAYDGYSMGFEGTSLKIAIPQAEDTSFEFEDDSIVFLDFSESEIPDTLPRIIKVFTEEEEEINNYLFSYPEKLISGKTYILKVDGNRLMTVINSNIYTVSQVLEIINENVNKEITSAEKELYCR